MDSSTGSTPAPAPAPAPTTPSPADTLDGYRRAAVIGGGVIGISWAALFLAHGLDVVISDPRPDTEAQVLAGLEEITPALAELGLPTGDLTSRLRFEADLTAAVAAADIVQENGPERLAVKQEIWKTVERAAPAHALLATSTSGIPASAIAEAMRQPERLVVGHPFNPPHLVPLVEIVPGEKTSAQTLHRARDFYAALGKKPQVLRKEIPGFVANRLQSALFRECVHLVAEGVVTEAELDDIVTASIGLRWAVAGPFRTFHLGGGPGGLPHFLQHLGRAMEGTWPGLGNPTFDAPTVARLTTQAREAFGDLPVGELAARRDRAQIALMRALEADRADRA
ncbi:3-hydroxyacyl-CoA dehydrogenase NAD-binding domain-containing protein [Streptomyces albireticuli]|uniref:Hydroxylacyl-CoA dehydrogenase n=1 Tax=Streptomyces albireticuli TaxID=1940 RepID=A0A2A2CY80_9ACTN|nr:3-hydroxyacyl-CoA dehydrogenase NAD-binding domain-containing protein [Streptomyces albireticuli]MCD9145721.1 3-hydroxyacyl-CoA dehydrogenase NAD-binding domain-containing protein [Streptomyces albireticuli]MCD9165547.1 3-hydroxyacyl-CoA dehydrogenase NAD-binding domain-containing protein [Streptomyces albireticuli]MCD9195930.1 3-hydroxyacyl-CoA dehydrogenase NAD-binding domain-containing protein [Streptomyces albireticuli]PAU45168.1 hydroxylacyl-CoA dehydrogenase [Streptomyces albireticuli]